MDELTTRLQRFGFSEKEVAAYLAIVERGRAKPSEIAAAADLSKRYAYEVCGRLDDRGFVDVDDHVTPTQVHAVPPDDAFQQLETELSAVQDAVADRYERPGPETEQFEVIKSRPTALKRLRTAIRGADEELTLSLPARLLPEVSDALRDAVDRDVLTLVLLSGSEVTAGDVDLDGVANVVRGSIEWAPAFLTADRETAVVAPPELLLWETGDDRAIAFTQPQVAPIVVGSFLGNYWPMADEQCVSRLRPLPVTYRSFRRAVFEATLRLRADEPLFARFQAYPLDDGRWEPGLDSTEYVELTGRVLETRQGIVEPRNSDFGVENAFLIEHDGDAVTVGGEGAFLEEYAARRVELLRP